MFYLILQLISINLFTKYDIQTIKIETNNKTIFLENKKIKRKSFILKKGNSITINSNHKRFYSGKINIFKKNKKIYINQNLELEKYIIHVINSEIGVNFSDEMIKAFYLVVKNYTISNLNKHKSIKSDLCDTTHCQLYYGDYQNSKNIEKITKIVNPIKNRIILFNNKPIKAVYSAICGPKRTSSMLIWKNYYPYLIEGNNIYKNTYLGKDNKNYYWEFKIKKKRLLKLLKLDSLKIKKVISGYVSYLGDDEKTIDAQRFKRIIGHNLGWGKLKSLQFKLYENNKFFIFKGNGSGNGVGFCIAEAEDLAKLNLSYEEIIKFFFPNVIIK